MIKIGFQSINQFKTQEQTLLFPEFKVILSHKYIDFIIRGSLNRLPGWDYFFTSTQAFTINL